MNLQDWTKELERIYGIAVSKYRAGERGADVFFNGEEVRFLEGIGLRPQVVYDFAEDDVNYEGETGWEVLLPLATARREYFLFNQGGKWSGRIIRIEDLPAKSDSLEGIDWLPRILPKARAFLRGELPADLMFGCGGDRGFFEENRVSAAEFLAVVNAAGEEVRPVIDFLKRRRAEKN